MWKLTLIVVVAALVQAPAGVSTTSVPARTQPAATKRQTTTAAPSRPSQSKSPTAAVPGGVYYQYGVNSAYSAYPYALTYNVSKLDQEVENTAAKLRKLAETSAKPEENKEYRRLKDKLKELVEDSFDEHQASRRKQLKSLRDRLEALERTVKSREMNRSEILSTRVAALLDADYSGSQGRWTVADPRAPRTAVRALPARPIPGTNYQLPVPGAVPLGVAPPVVVTPPKAPVYPSNPLATAPSATPSPSVTPAPAASPPQLAQNFPTRIGPDPSQARWRLLEAARMVQDGETRPNNALYRAAVREMQVHVQLAKIKVQQCELRYETATRDFERIQALRKNNSVTESEYDSAQEARALARLKLEEAKTLLDLELTVLKEAQALVDDKPDEQDKPDEKYGEEGNGERRKRGGDSRG